MHPINRDTAAESVGPTARRGELLVGHVLVSRRVDYRKVEVWWECRIQLVERTKVRS